MCPIYILHFPKRILLIFNLKEIFLKLIILWILE